ncbi:7147_t:CDS:1, partial [Dentiscutata heterogama]
MSKALLIPEIIENFFIAAYPDAITQRSMVLVNRFWCSIGLKHLWKAPFASYLYDEKKPPNHKMIISVYISLLDSESISTIAKRLSTAISTCQKSTYNYSTFLEELDIDNLRELVENWLLNFAEDWLPNFFPYEEFEDLFDELTMLLLTQICKLFLTNSKKITLLSIKRPEFLVDI